MIDFIDYLKKSLVLFMGMAVFGTVILVLGADREESLAASLGLLMSFANSLLGFAIISFGHKRSINEFMAMFYGGMIFRFLLIFGILFVLIVSFQMPVLPLLAFLCVSYFVFLGLEVFIINKYSESTKE